MSQLDIGKFLLMQSDHLLAPEHAGLQHIGLVHRANLVAARARQLEGRPRDAADLVRGVLLGVETATLPVCKRFDAARLAGIDAAGEFPDDDEVDAMEHMCL